MRHKLIGKKFGRDSAHREALFRNLTIALLKHKRIKTTLQKAKELRRFVEPLITLAKKENDLFLKKPKSANIVSLRRRAFAKINHRESVKILFEEIAKINKERAGGYLRLIKCGYRFGDKAQMCYVFFSDDDKLSKLLASKQPNVINNDKKVQKDAVDIEKNDKDSKKDVLQGDKY